MKGTELRRLLELDHYIRFHFDGIHASDSLITLKKQQHFVIINTAQQQQEGLHWVFALRSNKILEYFDPLGGGDGCGSSTKHNTASGRPILANRSLLQGIADIVISEDQYQPADSENCGPFCIYLAYHRIRRLDEPFSHVLSKIFTKDPATNDARVKQFLHDLPRLVNK
jgi:hypothetical protein